MTTLLQLGVSIYVAFARWETGKEGVYDNAYESSRVSASKETKW